MCGIVGFVRLSKQTTWNADRILPELMFVDQLRGRDACGVFTQPQHYKQEKGWVDYMKMAGPADQFMHWNEPHERVFKKAEHARFVVAHNRAATIGSKEEVKAAHPHHVGSITLVHNGTLSMYPYKDKAISDSWAIAKALDEEPDFRAVERKLFGAWALVWHDARDDSLNFVRNRDRPLGFVIAGDKSIWFASEPHMLQWVLSRNNKYPDQMFDLQPRNWLKILPEGIVKEIDVPFTQLLKEKEDHELSYEEVIKEPTAIRAFETIVRGKSEVRAWKDCRVIEAEPPPRPTFPPPVVIQGGGVTKGSTTSSKESKVNPDFSEFLDEWSGIKAGDKVYYYPMEKSIIGKGDRIQCVGPVAVFGEGAEVEFLQGTEVRARLAEKLDNDDGGTPAQRLVNLAQMQVLHEAVVTRIVRDNRREKIVMWAKESDPQDWFVLGEFGIELKDITKAYKSKAAPGVAADEKK